MEKIKAVICDVDNTILNTTHRWHLLDGENTDWDKFNSPELMAKDTPMQDTIDVIKCLSEKYPILFVTGRNSGIMDETDRQIQRFCGELKSGYSLIMRDDSDRKSPDIEVKTQLYKTYVEPYYDVLCAFDDRATNIELWRSFGITSYHVGEIVFGGGF